MFISKFNFPKSLCFVALIAISFVACAKRSSSSRDNLSGSTAVGVARSGDQAAGAQAQTQAAAQGVKVSWDSTHSPVADSSGNITVTSTFLYNNKPYQVTSTHQVVGANVSVFQQQYSLGVDNMAVEVYAGCSDSQCSQYAITFNFYKNNAQSIQSLVWVDFAAENSPRIQSLPANQFKDIYTWYNFASEASNFLAP